MVKRDCVCYKSTLQITDNLLQMENVKMLVVNRSVLSLLLASPSSSLDILIKIHLSEREQKCIYASLALQWILLIVPLQVFKYNLYLAIISICKRKNVNQVSIHLDKRLSYVGSQISKPILLENEVLISWV